MTVRQRRTMALMIVAWTIAGCSPSDERLVELAQQSVETQRQQNQAMAQQSAAVVKESHELAIAAKELVTQDAKARQEIIAAGKDIDRQREVLDAERRSIANQRYWEPVLGDAIQAAAALLACLAPLLL